MKLPAVAMMLSLLCLAALAVAAGPERKAKPAKPVKNPPKAELPPAPTLPPAHYAVTATLKVAGEGQWDAIAIDPAGKFLYLPRTTHTQVIEAATGKVVADIGPGTSMRGIALAPDLNRGYIANNREGTVTIFDLKTNDILGNVAVGADPDALAYDPASKHVFVCCNSSHLVVPFAADLDPKTGKADAPLQFDGTPKGLVADGRGMLYVTITDRDAIAVIDTRIMKVATQWGVGAWHSPTWISMDREHSRLFVACGSKVAFVSATDGHDLGEKLARPTPPWKFPAPVTEYADGRIFAVCGDGTMTILGQNAQGVFDIEQMLNLGQMDARPIAIDPHSGKIYLPAMDFKARKPVPDSCKILVVENKK